MLRVASVYSRGCVSGEVHSVVDIGALRAGKITEFVGVVQVVAPDTAIADCSRGTGGTVGGAKTSENNNIPDLNIPQIATTITSTPTRITRTSTISITTTSNIIWHIANHIHKTHLQRIDKMSLQRTIHNVITPKVRQIAHVVIVHLTVHRIVQ